MSAATFTRDASDSLEAIWNGIQKLKFLADAVTNYGYAELRDGSCEGLSLIIEDVTEDLSGAFHALDGDEEIVARALGCDGWDDSWIMWPRKRA